MHFWYKTFYYSIILKSFGFILVHLEVDKMTRVSFLKRNFFFLGWWTFWLERGAAALLINVVENTVL
jgi:hypothetical protein